MCCKRLAGNTGRKNDVKNRHLSTIAQLCWAMSSQLRHVSTIGKNLLSSNISYRCPYNMVNFGPLTAEINWRGLGYPIIFQRVMRLGSITGWQSSSGRQPNSGVEQRVPPMFGRATITLGIGPHSSCVRFSFCIPSLETGLGNVSEMTYCVQWAVKPQLNQ